MQKYTILTGQNTSIEGKNSHYCKSASYRTRPMSLGGRYISVAKVFWFVITSNIIAVFFWISANGIKSRPCLDPCIWIVYLHTDWLFETVFNLCIAYPYTGNSTIKGAQHFYLYNGSDCQLFCNAWTYRNNAYSVVETVLTMTALFCLFSCIVLAVRAFTI